MEFVHELKKKYATYLALLSSYKSKGPRMDKE